MKKKKPLQKLTIAYIIGWSIICLVFAIAGIAIFFDLNIANRKLIAVFILILGTGLFLIAPKSLDDFENDKTPDSRALQDGFFPLFFMRLLSAGSSFSFRLSSFSPANM